MTDKKDPDQKNIPVDFDDDDDIIELTNEVIIKPKKDDEDTDLRATGKDVSKAPAGISVEADKVEQQSDDEDDFFDMDPAMDSGTETEGTVLDLDEAFASDQSPLEEDEIIASAIAESLGPDDEEPVQDRINLNDDAGGDSQKDDDVIILNQDDDEPVGVTDRATETAENDAEVFDAEEEIALEYEGNEDEYDFFAMDDKETFEELENIAMDDHKPDDTTENEIPFEPATNLRLNSEEDDEIIAMEADSYAEPDLMAFDDEETLESEGAEEIPDLRDKVGFEGDDDLQDVTDELEFEGDDDLPDLTDEMEFEDADDLPDLADKVELEGDDDLPDLADKVELEGDGDLPDLADDVEFEDADDLPDLADEMGFEFDDEDEDNELAGAKGQVADNSDDSIAASVVDSLPPDEVTTQVDLAMEPELEFADDGDMAVEEPDPSGEVDFTAKTKEELRALAEADDLPDIDDETDLEFEDEEDAYDIDHREEAESEVEILAIEDLEDNRAEDEGDVIEITEFDEHFPEAVEKKLERAGVLDAAHSDEDDFLELIEIEDDDMIADEEVIKFSNAEDQIDEDELDNFFSDSLEDEAEFENGEDEPVEGKPAMNTDMAMATSSTADEDDEFNFNFDSSAISQQVDRLDTFLSDDSIPEPAVASLPEDTFAAEDTEAASQPDDPFAGEDQPLNAEEMLDDEQPAVEKTGEPLPVSHDQIDAILERVINDKFGGKIENVIYEVIEKTVSKEIDRLKGALLGGDDDTE